MINVFGAGFVGGEFARRYSDEVVTNSRDDFSPKTSKMLYFISTVDNYNIHTDPYLDIETNLILLIRTLENARNLFGNQFEFNFVSSWFVYGNTDFPATEDSACYPSGFYSITKRCAEQLLISYCQTYDIRYRILRMAGVLGVGDRKVSKKKNALQYMIRQLSHGEIVSLYEGKIIRDLIDVRDAAKALYLAISFGDVDSIYNIGNGYGYSMEDIVYEIQRHLQSGTIQRVPVPEFHKKVQVRDMYMDNSKLVSLGYVPDYDIYQTCLEIADAYRTNT